MDKQQYREWEYKMRNVELKCLCDFKYGESEAVFRKGEVYDASLDNGLYRIKNKDETVILENLSAFFEAQENTFKRYVRSKRKYTSKEEICKRMQWEDFSIGGVIIENYDFEKVGMAQYAANFNKEEKVQVRIKTEHNEHVIVQEGQTYAEVLEKLNVNNNSVVVTKLTNKWTRVPLNIEPKDLAGTYLAELQGFLS
jgi:hypothetical protein